MGPKKKIDFWRKKKKFRNFFDPKFFFFFWPKSIFWGWPKFFLRSFGAQESLQTVILTVFRPLRCPQSLFQASHDLTRDKWVVWRLSRAPTDLFCHFYHFLWIKKNPVGGFCHSTVLRLVNRCNGGSELLTIKKLSKNDFFFLRLTADWWGLQLIFPPLFLIIWGGFWVWVKKKKSTLLKKKFQLQKNLFFYFC